MKPVHTTVTEILKASVAAGQTTAFVLWSMHHGRPFFSTSGDFSDADLDRIEHDVREWIEARRTVKTPRQQELTYEPSGHEL